MLLMQQKLTKPSLHNEQCACACVCAWTDLDILFARCIDAAHLPPLPPYLLLQVPSLLLQQGHLGPLTLYLHPCLQVSNVQPPTVLQSVITSFLLFRAR